MTDGTKKGLNLGFAELAVMALDLGCISHFTILFLDNQDNATRRGQISFMLIEKMPWN